MRRFHLAIAVADVERSIADYRERLGADPVVVIAGEYALWRTASLNVSIRRTDDRPGTLRHVGWEDAAASGFAVEHDVNGMAWELFTPAAQNDEIRRHWPGATIASEH
jgi:catechol 2,3-dioxygenase-like lactoylglutathione lyase family enzyme